MTHKQTGLIPSAPKPTDFMLGAETAVTLEVRNPSGDWREYEPTGERQSVPYVFDTFSCTTFSFLNSIEMQLNLLIKENKLGKQALDFLTKNGYFDINGSINFSDKYTAIRSGTSKGGNIMTNPPESARRFGLIPESMLPFRNEKTWEEWHNPLQITDEMRALGDDFRKFFDIKYDWVFIDNDRGLSKEAEKALLLTLKTAPPQIAIPLPSSHATLLESMTPSRKYYIFDSYEPYRERKKWSAQIHYSVRSVISEKTVPTIPDKPPFPEFTRMLRYGSIGDDVRQFQLILKSLGFFNANATGGFYSVTKSATQRFQAFAGLIADGIAGPLTFAELEDVYNRGEMSLSETGEDFIKGFEGLHDGDTSTAILEPMLDPAGLPTIGWGARYDASGALVSMETTPITLEQANALFTRDIARFSAFVNKCLEVSVTQNQFNALVSLCYNIGEGGFKDSTVLRHVNTGQVTRADFLLWIKARDPVTGKLEVVPGLVRRRNAEADLYGLV